MSLKFPSLSRRTVLRGGAATAALAPLGCGSLGGSGTNAASLERVATFIGPKQVTGVAVTPSGRVFVNFPRWEEDVAVSVAEVSPDGKLTPYPDLAWNAYRSAAPRPPGQHFVCVQSVTTDPLGNLWVVDAGAPGLALEVPGAPKLVRIEPTTNQVSRVYPLDTSVAPQGSYLNDIRFTPDGRRAVLTNSGQPGCLITLDTVSGQARRVLDGHPSTQFERDFVVSVDGRQLRRPDGQTAQFSADGIAIDRQGTYVYWQATTGSTMYRIPVAALFDTQLSAASLGDRVETHAKTFLADGYLMGRNGTLYLTSCADSSVKTLTASGMFDVAVRDTRLRWPDSLAESPDGWIYVTASNIPQMKAWQGPGVSESELYRFRAV